MLTFKRHGLYFQKIFNRNPFPDCDEKFLFCFCNIPADIGTHVLPKCMFVPYIVQQVRLTGCLFVTFPVKRQPVRYPIIEILEEMRIGF